ncbi:flavodoxin family protein [Streptomyces gamaensis]|uniref:Flavodoxin family protein n=1 Tax=Streptomyces gamaensis TaxID=1763542 RepID=A0ABW0Z4Z5_9ACTN
MRPRVAVVFHSRHGTMRALAASAAEGARSFGAEVRLLRVADVTAGPDREPWPETAAVPEDVLWADGLVLATPTYFGNVSGPFKHFLDATSPLWKQGLLADRVVTGMTSSTCVHGGREATLLTLYQTAYHWGAWTLGAEPGDPVFQRVGANPYGLSVTPRRDGRLGEPELTAAWALGRRLADAAARARAQAESVPPEPGRSRVTVVHCAEDEAVRLLAQECAAGARELGAEVRLRRLAGPGLPQESGLPGRSGGAPPAAPATALDVTWADAVAFGAPVRAGAVAAPLLGFVQSLAHPLDGVAGPGPLTGKPASAFVATGHPHAGSESALLSLHHVLHHCGALVVPPGYTDPAVFAAGGNPYGTSYSRSTGPAPSAEVLAAARHQGRRMALAGHRLRRKALPSEGGTAAAPGAHTSLDKEALEKEAS